MARHRNGGAGENDTLGNEGSELRVYELGFHLDPELPVEEVKKAYQAIRATIAEKGTVVVESEPEKIQLAYTISRQEVAGRRDFDAAYFSWIVYEASAEDHAEIVKAAGAEKRIIRFIDLVTTKDAARHFMEARELSKKMPEHTEDPEAVLGAELDAALESATI
ncbi:MAG: 30S ribosomal protein S6 [Patescibacteria group bacterium]|nr:30S ribosomal protein S6 [Patescibacteria group bacterium]